MGRRVIRLFVYEVYQRKLLSHKKLREMKYGMEVIYNEMVKILMLLVIFSILGRLSHFLFSLVILITIRCFSGGLHFETNLSCLIFSLLFFLTVSAMPAYLPDEFFSFRYGILLSSIIAIGMFSPILSPNRPIKSRRKKRVLKFTAVCFTVFWSCVLLVNIRDYGLLSCGIATIMLQAIQLAVGYMIQLKDSDRIRIITIIF